TTPLLIHLSQISQQPTPTPFPYTTLFRSHYQPNRFAGRAGKYYQLVWGVDSLAVKWAESGEIIRFTYRVISPDSAHFTARESTRSEEHTSELQSRGHLVCRLLLEKKKCTH